MLPAYTEYGFEECMYGERWWSQVAHVIFHPHAAHPLIGLVMTYLAVDIPVGGELLLHFIEHIEGHGFME
jgi:hypothetical protein